MPLFSAANSLEFVDSEPLGIITFMESLNGEFGRSEKLKELFDSSPYANGKSRRALQQFSKMQKKISEKKPIDQYGNDFNKLILASAVKAGSEADFFVWLQKNLSAQDFRLFKNSYLQFKPIYQKLVRDPFNKKFTAYKAKLLEAGRRWNLPKKLACIAKMFDANIKLAEGSKVGIYPLPSQSSIDGQSFVGVEIMGISPDSKDYDSDFTVVFHEKLHTLFAQKSPTMRNAFKRAFKHGGRHTGPSLEAMGEFEEGLITVIANVWAYEVTTGQKAPEPWYADTVINSFAKKIAPKTLDYLKTCKQLDSDFYTFAYQKLKEVSPSSTWESKDPEIQVFQ